MKLFYSLHVKIYLLYIDDQNGRKPQVDSCTKKVFFLLIGVYIMDMDTLIDQS